MTLTYTQTCATDGCNAPTSGKSKYCRTHKVEARARFKAMLEEQSIAKAERDADFQAIHQLAHEAGMAAAEALTPTPMHVVQRANPWDDSSPVVKAYEPVLDGVCGYAYVNFRPGNHPYVNWLKRQGIGHKAYYGGYEISVPYFNQSMERKYAYARAYVETLHKLGPDTLRVYARSMMD